MSTLSPDSTGTTVEDKALDKESVIEILGEDEKEQEVIELEGDSKKGDKDKKEKTDGRGKGDKGDDKADSEGDKESEDEEFDIDEDEDAESLINIPSRKEILTKYPALFKDFPQLERSFYREQKYAEILPTIEDAKTAVEKSETLDKYEQEIMSGSTESLLSSVRDNDKEAFAKVVDNYLPTLYKVDQHSYFHTIGNIIKHTIISMVRDGKEQSDEDLGTAASILNKYIFGTDKFIHPQKLSKEDITDETKQKEEELSSKERKFVEKQYTIAKDDLSSRVDNILKSSVDKAIDPNDSMTDYVKNHAIREVLEGLESQILKDNRFRGIYDKLWERAAENDFDKESMDKIKSAYLSKAKTLLPGLVKKSRQEALRSRKAGTDERDKKGPIPVGKIRSSATPASGRANSNGASKIPRGMTTLDFLSSDD